MAKTNCLNACVFVIIGVWTLNLVQSFGTMKPNCIQRRSFNLFDSSKLSDKEWEIIKKSVESSPDIWKKAIQVQTDERKILKSTGVQSQPKESDTKEDALDGVEHKSITRKISVPNSVVRTQSDTGKEGTSADNSRIHSTSSISYSTVSDSRKGRSLLSRLRKRLNSSNEGIVESNSIYKEVGTKSGSFECIRQDIDADLSRLKDFPPIDNGNEDSKSPKGENQIDDEIDDLIFIDDVFDKPKHELQVKFHQLSTNKNTTAANLYSFLNEVKDKKYFNSDLIESILWTLSRSKSSGAGAFTLSAYRVYAKLCFDKLLTPSTLEFPIRFANACYANSVTTSHAIETVLKESFPDIVTNEDTMFIGHLALLINLVRPNSTGVNSSGAANVSANEEALFTKLQEFYAKINRFHISEINIVIRLLGRSRLIDEIFTVFALLSSGNITVSANDESFEFLATALVTSVTEQAVARSMKDLPDADASLPEIVFAGRSNVGKSSLVNFLVNRKALASTSARPGHTSRFHFYGVNAETSFKVSSVCPNYSVSRSSHDLPSFRLVDVPGLGYAETEENVQDSWRSLLERYVSVRDSLAAVFHLLDARHKVTSTDLQLMDLVSRASVEREAAGRPPIQYVVVLTKVDKASSTMVKRTKEAVFKVTSGSASPVEIVESSSVLKIGRDSLWRVILKALNKVRNNQGLGSR